MLSSSFDKCLSVVRIECFAYCYIVKECNEAVDSQTDRKKEIKENSVSKLWSADMTRHGLAIA